MSLSPLSASITYAPSPQAPDPGETSGPSPTRFDRAFPFIFAFMIFLIAIVWDIRFS
jgi:hypothetical protein